MLALELHGHCIGEETRCALTFEYRWKWIFRLQLESLGQTNFQQEQPFGAKIDLSLNLALFRPFSL